MQFKRGILLRDIKRRTRALTSGYNKELVKSKRSQVTIFIIIAILIIVGIVLYFVVKSKTGTAGISAEFKPVEESFLSCIKDYTSNGISMLEETGGYIYLPKFEPGSSYMPSSNMLDFSGTAVPYWYYISGNNVVKEQIPSKLQMQQQFEKYLEENLVCDFSSFNSKGYVVNIGEITSSVKISNDKVQVAITGNLDVSLEGKSTRISSHSQDVSTKLGKFYDKAVEIYNAEKTGTFLEKYGLDVLYNYAPVTGVELNCAPKIWNFNDVKKNIAQGLEANLAMVKVNGNYYDKNKVDSYFIGNINSDEAVQFMYSPNWPTKIETKDENGFLIAEPVGNQPGVGIMGFCYIPYHFVYNAVYPVLIQIYDNKEIFRFPVIAVIEGNKEKQAQPGTYFGEAGSQLCQDKDAEVSVYTYDSKLDPIEADISFECFGEKCNIGKTKLKNGEAVLSGIFPRCVNGYIVASAENYKEKRSLISTNTENTANIILDKLYDVGLSLKVDGKDAEDTALIYFESKDYSTTIVWPEQKSVKLADDLYNITVYVYRNGSITLPETKQKKCVKTPSPGIMGIFGITEEKCFDLAIPEQIVSNVISGGGKSEIYIAEEQLAKGNADLLVIGLKIPGNIQELQNSYSAIENNKVDLEFK